MADERCAEHNINRCIYCPEEYEHPVEVIAVDHPALVELFAAAEAIGHSPHCDSRSATPNAERYPCDCDLQRLAAALAAAHAAGVNTGGAK